MKSKWPILIVILLLGFACNKMEPAIEPDNSLDKFIGEYEIESIHISGIQTMYDSVGNPIFQGDDTTIVSNELLLISYLSTDKDTLMLNSLINNFNNTGTEVKGIVLNDSIRIVHEFSTPQTRNNYIRGDIWLEGDSLFLNYNWNKSDIWSSGALPERGKVEGKGVLNR